MKAYGPKTGCLVFSVYIRSDVDGRVICVDGGNKSTRCELSCVAEQTRVTKSSISLSAQRTATTYITHSHGKVTKQVNWKGQPKIRPLVTPEHHNRSLANWHAWLRHGHHPACEILSRSLQGFCFPYMWFCHALVWQFLFSFGRFFDMATAHAPKLILRNIWQKTSFRVRYIAFLGSWW